MNLILLLSALLSALGAGGERARVAPAVLSSSIAVVKATTARSAVATRPVQAIAGPVHAVVPILQGFALADPIPVFASRRRE